MSPIIAPAIAGLLGGVAMAGALALPQRLINVRVDVIRAVGAYFTHDRETALLPGLSIHLAAGIIFAYIYYWLFRYVDIPLNALTGVVAGLVHGAVVMLLVSIFVLEHHPMTRYQRRGFSTGIAQIFGHMVYGCVVGTVISIIAPLIHKWPT